MLEHFAWSGPDVLVQIKESVTHIIHNAWTVNFNHSLLTFEPQIAAVRRVIDILASLNRPARLLFTSSVGTASGWDPSRGPVPEQPLDDPDSATHTGYAASKYVVEQVRSMHVGFAHGLTAVHIDLCKSLLWRFGAGGSSYGSGVRREINRSLGYDGVGPYHGEVEYRSGVSTEDEWGTFFSSCYVTSC